MYKQNNILVIGDSMLDKYWFSKPKALAEEAPVANLYIDYEEYRAGGVGNVALNIKKLVESDIDVTLIAPLGKDGDGKKLASVIDDCGVKSYWQYNSKTITKHRVVSNKQQLVRVDFEEKYQPIVLDETLKQLISDAKLIILSDYNKGALDNIEVIIKYARELEKPLLVDPKGNDFTKYSGATIITPNFKEFTNIVGCCNYDSNKLDQKNSNSELDKKAYNLITKLNIDYLLLTLGADGMILFGKDYSKYHASSYAEQVFDVTGAGDTVLASIAASLASGKDNNDAVEFASHAAALVVNQVGTAFVTAAEVNNFMSKQSKKISSFENKDNKTGIKSPVIAIETSECLKNLLNQQSLEKTAIKYWDYKLDNILTSTNIQSYLNNNDSSNQSEKINWIVISNNIETDVNIDVNETSNNKLTHSVEELSYILSLIKNINKVLYSITIDISKIIKQQQNQKEKLTQESHEV